MKTTFKTNLERLNEAKAKFKINETCKTCKEWTKKGRAVPTTEKPVLTLKLWFLVPSADGKKYWQQKESHFFKYSQTVQRPQSTQKTVNA